MYFGRAGGKTFERPYGWGWLLMLVGEVALAKEQSEPFRELFEELHAALAPVADAVRGGWLEYLPKLGFPVRSGVHSNTAFGLTLSHRYARIVGDNALCDAICTCAMRLYYADIAYSPAFEPSGEDFLSPSLCEMALMRRVLPTAGAFARWAQAFMPSLFDVAAFAEPTDEPTDRSTRGSILAIPSITDRTDARLCHLDGLLLSKAWALRACASTLRAGGSAEPVITAMYEAADSHYHAASWATDEYVGSHWLHSFALLALDGDEDDEP